MWEEKNEIVRFFFFLGEVINMRWCYSIMHERRWWGDDNEDDDDDDDDDDNGDDDDDDREIAEVRMSNLGIIFFLTTSWPPSQSSTSKPGQLYIHFLTYSKSFFQDPLY